MSLILTEVQDFPEVSTTVLAAAATFTGTYKRVFYIPDSSLTLNVEDQITLGAPVSATRPLVKVETKKDPLGQVGVIAYVGNK